MQKRHTAEWRSAQPVLLEAGRSGREAQRGAHTHRSLLRLQKRW